MGLAGQKISAPSSGFFSQILTDTQKEFLQLPIWLENFYRTISQQSKQLSVINRNKISKYTKKNLIG